MNPTATVTLSSKHQVVIPLEAREALGLAPGARLLVLVKPDRVVFMPEPADFAAHAKGRFKGVWGDADRHLARERRDWRP